MKLFKCRCVQFLSTATAISRLLFASTNITYLQILIYIYFRVCVYRALFRADCRRTCDVVSKTYSDLNMLTKNDLDEVLVDFPRELVQIHRVARGRRYVVCEAHRLELDSSRSLQVDASRLFRLQIRNWYHFSSLNHDDTIFPMSQALNAR